MPADEITVTTEIDAEAIPWITTGQMAAVDRLMVERYGVDLVQMMENAGRSLARLAMHRFLTERSGDDRVVILAGTGGNGGGALACARHLHNWGVSTRVYLSRPPSALKGVPAHQLRSLRAMRVPISGPSTVRAARERPSLIVDGVIGYSLRGAPRNGAAQLIDWANESGAPVLSLDVPSGLDATSGEALGVAIRATATMTLALPKTGLGIGAGPQRAGELYLADIGVPPQLYRKIGVDARTQALFAGASIVRIARR